MYFPQNLHYVRFTAKKAQNMKEFELVCRNADKIYLNKQGRQNSKDQHLRRDKKTYSFIAS